MEKEIKSGTILSFDSWDSSFEIEFDNGYIDWIFRQNFKHSNDFLKLKIGLKLELETISYKTKDDFKVWIEKTNINTPIHRPYKYLLNT